jgi:hypothetical protein
LRAAASGTYQWVTSPFFLDPTLRKPAGISETNPVPDRQKRQRDADRGTGVTQRQERAAPRWGPVVGEAAELLVMPPTRRRTRLP